VTEPGAGPAATATVADALGAAEEAAGAGLDGGGIQTAVEIGQRPVGSDAVDAGAVDAGGVGTDVGGAGAQGEGT
jgi:hypothetical protein